MFPRILMFTPRLRRYARCDASTHAMRWQYGKPIDCLEYENDQPYGWDGPGAKGNLNVIHLYRRARSLFLTGNWDYFFAVEDDIVVPPDALDLLLAADADVAYGLYCWRKGPPHLWSAYRMLFEDSGASWSDDEPQTIAAKALRREVMDVAGVGLGCTLIRRKVLDTLPWRLGETGAANDWYFAVDAQKHQFRQRCHLGVQCGHVSAASDPVIIWPDPTGHAKNIFRFESL